MQKNENLAPLPESKNEFWESAEVHTNLVPKQINQGDHYFKYTSAVTAQCTHCDWGFQLDPGDVIKNGHLFDKKGTLII